MNTTEKIEAAYKAIAAIAKKASDEKSFTVDMDIQSATISIRPDRKRRVPARTYLPFADFYHGTELGAICQQFGLAMHYHIAMRFSAHMYEFCEPYFIIDIYIKK